MGQKHNPGSAWLVCILFVQAGGLARAEVLSVAATADAFVASAQPSGNFGGAGALAVAAPGLPLGEFQSVLRFDSEPIQTGFDALYGDGQWTITSVTLGLSSASANNPIFNASSAGDFSVRWMQDDSWEEGTGGPSAPGTVGIVYGSLQDYLSPADEAVGSFTYDGATSGQSLYGLASTSAFTADLIAGGMVSLQLLAADDSIAYVFNSRNFGSASSRPQLSVSAVLVPEPVACGYLIFASVLMVGRRRRAHS